MNKTKKINNNIMNEYKYELVVRTEQELTVDDLLLIKYDFHARLQGYHTECPEQLKDAEIEIKGKRQ